MKTRQLNIHVAITKRRLVWPFVPAQTGTRDLRLCGIFQPCIAKSNAENLHRKEIIMKYKNRAMTVYVTPEGTYGALYIYMSWCN